MARQNGKIYSKGMSVVRQDGDHFSHGVCLLGTHLQTLAYQKKTSMGLPYRNPEDEKRKE